MGQKDRLNVAGGFCMGTGKEIEKRNHIIGFVMVEDESWSRRVSLGYAKKIAKMTGFNIVSRLVSRKLVPDGVTLYGGQNGLVLKK